MPSEFADAVASSGEVIAFGMRFRVLTLDALIRARRASARPKDLAFPLRHATPPEVGAWREGALNQLDQARYALEGANRTALDRLASGIRARLEVAFRAAGSAWVTTAPCPAAWHPATRSARR